MIFQQKPGAVRGKRQLNLFHIKVHGEQAIKKEIIIRDVRTTLFLSHPIGFPRN